MSTSLEKHIKYKNKYGEQELFWGFGIEEETYFQFVKPIWVAAPILQTAHKAERYSVDYYKSYKPTIYLDAIKRLYPDRFHALPFFLNSHSLSKVDLSGQHETTYEMNPKPNSRFRKSIFSELQDFLPVVFRDRYEETFTFDGDTVEFMTQNFYKAKVGQSVKELLAYKNEFLFHLNRFLVEKRLFRERGALRYPPANPGFAVFHTNPQNIVMFNNGTYHINITLPTLLGSKNEAGISQLLFPEIFREQHKKVILFYQWLEPLLLCLYGTADPLSAVSKKFAKSSQRCAMSRYIGIGTYDTSAMKEGKILTVPLSEIRGSAQPFWWYTRYHATSGYKALDRIGMDINYRKHYNHGIELRFFDWFPEERLEGLSRFLIYLAECALDRPTAWEPICSETWNDLVIGVLEEGCDFVLTPAMLAAYEKILGIELLPVGLAVKKDLTAAETFGKIELGVTEHYKNSTLAKFFLL
jgi:hypothetical protein